MMTLPAGSRCLTSYCRTLIVGQWVSFNLEHRIIVCGRGRNPLQHVPVLHDFGVVVQAEDIYSGPIRIAWPLLPRMQHHVIAFGKGAHKVDALAGIFPCHPFKIFDKRLLTIAHYGIVLYVYISNVLMDGFGWTGIIKH